MVTQKKVKEEKSISMPLTLPVPTDVSIYRICSTSQANKNLVFEHKRGRCQGAIYDLISLERTPTAINCEPISHDVTHLPDGRLIYMYEVPGTPVSEIYDPKTDKVKKINGVVGASRFKAVNSEEILGALDHHNQHKIHFCTLDNLNQPFETLELKDRAGSITAINDKFVLGGWGTIVVLGKNKEGKYEVVESLASTPNRQLVRTVGLDKNILMTVEDSQYETNKNVLCLWKVGANNRFEKIAEKTIYFGWVENFWSFDNGNKFALGNGSKIAAYDLQLNSFECSSVPSIVFENSGKLLMLQESQISPVPFISVREELGASTPLFVPLLKIVMGYYGEYQLEIEKPKPTESASVQQHGMFAQRDTSSSQLEFAFGAALYLLGALGARNSSNTYNPRRSSD